MPGQQIRSEPKQRSIQTDHCSLQTRLTCARHVVNQVRLQSSSSQTIHCLRRKHARRQGPTTSPCGRKATCGQWTSAAVLRGDSDRSSHTNQTEIAQHSRQPTHTADQRWALEVRTGDLLRTRTRPHLETRREGFSRVARVGKHST